MSTGNDNEIKKQDENSYRSILKGTSLFGGVQIFQILVNLVRGKFVAMFLGTAGMGIYSLFNASANTICQFSSLGLNMAFTREFAAAKEDPSRLGALTKVAKAMITAGGTLGALFCLIFAPWLSQVTFGSPDYTWQFMLLAAMVWLNVIGGAKLSMIQGLHKVKILSKASVLGSVIGLFTAVPLYYFIGAKGIVPGMVILYLCIYIFNSVALRRCVPRHRGKLYWKEHLPLMRSLVGTGVILMVSMLLGSASVYLLNLFIRTTGGVDNVGLYSAANSLTNQYAGLVFTAISLDYFPRLSAIRDDRAKFNEVVNRQMEIVSLIATPAALLVFATAPLIIRLLLTESFLPITPLMRWMGMGILLKALSFPMGYISFARDSRKVFFWLEGVALNVLYLLMGCLGYYFFGLIGLGYAMVAEYSLIILIYLVSNRLLFAYRINAGALRASGAAILLGAAGFVASFASDSRLSISLLILVITISLVHSYFRLRALLKK